MRLNRFIKGHKQKYIIIVILVLIEGDYVVI
jgi:hypothetical protein